MSKQYNKAIKKKRRESYLKRKKAAVKAKAKPAAAKAWLRFQRWKPPAKVAIFVVREARYYRHCLSVRWDRGEREQGGLGGLGAPDVGCHEFFRKSASFFGL